MVATVRHRLRSGTSSIKVERRRQTAGDVAMRWYHYLAYFFGGAFLANTVPHYVNGISGNAFQSPFASPPGEGLSSSTHSDASTADCKLTLPCCRLPYPLIGEMKMPPRNPQERHPGRLLSR